MFSRIIDCSVYSLVTVAVCASSVACSATIDSTTEDLSGSAESSAPKSQALAVAYCANDSSKGCWENRKDQQADFSFFNVSAGGKVFARLKGDGLGGHTWKSAEFKQGGTPLGYRTYANGDLPTNIRSITTFSNGSYGTAMVLANDGKIYSCSGAVPPPPLNGEDWAWYTSVTPKNANNQTLCLAEIEYITLPAPALAAYTLALGCDGKLYHSEGGVWKGINTHPAYQALPTNVNYSHFSRTGSEAGATFVTSTNAVWLAGRGSFNFQTSTVNWVAPIQLPAIKNASGQTLTPRKVSGRFAITNAGNGTCVAGGKCDGDDDRIYFYDVSAGTWKRFTGGLPWYPQSADDATQYPFFLDIAHISGADFALQNLLSSGVYRWRRP